MKTSSFFMITLMAVTVFIVTGCTPNKSQLRNVNDRDRYVSSDAGAYQEEKAIFKGDADSDKPARVAVEKTDRVKPAVKDEARDYPVAEYSVKEDGEDVSADFYQTGMASWYGREFHGKVTASGERFDMNELTAAHKTLPFGTILEVKNLDNGKSVKVKINDRGPYRGNRILDLSHAAARKLDMLSNGEAMVGISVLGRDKNAAATKTVVPVANTADESTLSSISDGGAISLQAGAFYSRKNAERMKEKLESMVSRDVQIVEDGALFKVSIKTHDKNDAEQIRHTLDKDSIGTYLINEPR